jgi:hypothetical protein
MKTLLTAGLLALASTTAAAMPIGSGGTPGSVYTPERGQGYSAGHALQAPPTAGLTSLDQFEQGDPDTSPVVSEGMTARAPQHRAPQHSGSALTSLQQFERGDPDTTPGG